MPPQSGIKNPEAVRLRDNLNRLAARDQSQSHDMGLAWGNQVNPDTRQAAADLLRKVLGPKIPAPGRTEDGRVGGLFNSIANEYPVAASQINRMYVVDKPEQASSRLVEGDIGKKTYWSGLFNRLTGNMGILEGASFPENERGTIMHELGHAVGGDHSDVINYPREVSADDLGYAGRVMSRDVNLPLEGELLKREMQKQNGRKR